MKAFRGIADGERLRLHVKRAFAVVLGRVERFRRREENRGAVGVDRGALASGRVVTMRNRFAIGQNVEVGFRLQTPTLVAFAVERLFASKRLRELLIVVVIDAAETGFGARLSGGGNERVEDRRETERFA